MLDLLLQSLQNLASKQLWHDYVFLEFFLCEVQQVSSMYIISRNNENNAHFLLKARMLGVVRYFLLQYLLSLIYEILWKKNNIHVLKVPRHGKILFDGSRFFFEIWFQDQYRLSVILHDFFVFFSEIVKTVWDQTGYFRA